MTVTTGISQRLEQVGEALREALDQRRPRQAGADGATPAAVLMPVYDDGELVRMLFTKRTSHLPTHAGQISFPGGMADPGDTDLAHTALRENHEEVGIAPEQVKLLAPLDQVVTVTNFVVTPWVGLMAQPLEFAPSPFEVERLVEVPLAKVLDRASYRQGDVQWRGNALRQTILEHDGEVIWGATMRMLLNFLDALGDDAALVRRAANGGQA